jgi:hypothetical protein
MPATPRALPIPPGASIRTSEAGAFGATRAQLRSRGVDHPFTGVSAVGLDLSSLVDACQAYEPLLRPSEAYSHTTAALLYGVPLPRSASAVLPLHVLSPTATRARTGGAAGHRSKHPFPIEFRLGLPVVSPERMWIQLAPILTLHDLVAAGDHLVTPGRDADGATPLSTIAGLRREVAASSRRRGVNAATEAIELVRVGPESRPETLLRLCMIGAGLPEPTIGAAVEVAGGTVLHPDLAYPDLRIAIEYEGARHRDAGRWERDIERRELFEDAGWRVIRVTAAGLADPSGLVDRIRRTRAAREAEFAGQTEATQVGPTSD